MPFFGTGIKTDLFQSCGFCWVFQICWCIECSTLIASSFRILNTSARISSPPLALFVLILPKTHLTSHSRMSSSQWVTTPSWLSEVIKITTLPSCISFSSGWFWTLPPIQCYESPSIVLEALCLPDLISWYIYLYCIIIRDFI